MMKKAILNNDLLSLPCEAVSLEEGVEIATTLIASLPEDAVGIAANQIGIPKRVCLIAAAQPVVLINPKIVRAHGSTKFVEGCLSFPDDSVVTERFTSVTVLADNHEQPLNFSEENLLECVCVQHEIDHLNGITMFDRQYKK
jgi:peptide deformylase